MRTIRVTAGPYAAGNHTNIAQSQSPGAGAITLNGSTVVGGVATLDAARRVVIVSGGNDSGITFTITGTNWAGNTISETLTGANIGTVVSVLDYLTVTSVTHTSSVAGTVTVGTAISGTDSPVASSPWIRLDDYGFPEVTLGVDVAGTVNYTVEQSVDDPNLPSTMNPVAVASMVWLAHPVLAAQTTSQQSNYGYAPKWARITATTITAGAGNSATLSLTQSGGKFG